jgi:hypothetical protein
MPVLAGPDHRSRFDLAVFAEMLGRLDRLRRDEFELDDAEYEQLRGAVRRWHERALELR